MEPVSDHDMAALRGLTTGDFESVERAVGRIEMADGAGPPSVLEVIALQMASREYFDYRYTTDEIIRYVVEMRAADPGADSTRGQRSGCCSAC